MIPSSVMTILVSQQTLRMILDSIACCMKDEQLDRAFWKHDHMAHAMDAHSNYAWLSKQANHVAAQYRCSAQKCICHECWQDAVRHMLWKPCARQASIRHNANVHTDSSDHLTLMNECTI